MTKQEIINRLQSLINYYICILKCDKESSTDEQYIEMCETTLNEFVGNSEEIIKYLNEHRCCKYKCK